MGGFYNRSDPRLNRLRADQRRLDALDLEGIDRANLVRNRYYEGTEVDRRGQSNQFAYHAAIGARGQALNPPPARVLYQSDADDYIQLDQVAAALNDDPTAFIHFIKFPDLATPTRLYIPCELSHATNFFSRLWAYAALQSFKIVGYAGATVRADVIVAYFLHNQHARAIGHHFDMFFAGGMSGTFPIGAFPCSAANLCGWALEIGSSVGTDVSFDLAHGGEAKARVRESPF
jgi:hypothetical protein